MYVERIKFMREKDSEWEVGYYIGRYDNCEESTILDKNYKPLTDNVWNYTIDRENRLVLSVE